MSEPGPTLQVVPRRRHALAAHCLLGRCLQRRLKSLGVRIPPEGGRTIGVTGGFLACEATILGVVSRRVADGSGYLPIYPDVQGCQGDGPNRVRLTIVRQ